MGRLKLENSKGSIGIHVNGTIEEQDNTNDLEKSIFAEVSRLFEKYAA